MINVRLASTLLAAVAIGGLVVAPTFAVAASPDQDRGRQSGDDRGRKNDRDKNDRKGNNDQRWRDDQRRRDDDRRRDDQRRRDDDRRRDEQRRKDDQWRREEARRRDDQRRRDDERRRNDEWRRQQDRDRWSQSDYDHRQDTKNEWRNIAIGSGGVALLGLLSKDNTLTFAGTAGALYSLYRYDQDRKSQNSYDRLRANYFSRPYFYRDGKRYERTEVNRNGERYYQFRCN